MADLDLSTLKAYTPLFPMLIKKYEQFVPDQNASVLDKINSIIAELNAIGQLSNNVVKDWNTVYQWCMNDGLQTDVNNKLEDMRTNGEISDILNNIFDNLAGDMTTLHTTAKDKLVNSINEVDDLAKLNQTNIGDLTTLTTTDKENLVAAINNNAASLAEKTKQIGVSIDDFTGVTDTDKFYNANVYALANNQTITLTRDITLDGNIQNSFEIASIEGRNHTITCNNKVRLYIGTNTKYIKNVNFVDTKFYAKTDYVAPNQGEWDYGYLFEQLTNTTVTSFIVENVTLQGTSDCSTGTNRIRGLMEICGNNITIKKCVINDCRSGFRIQKNTGMTRSTSGLVIEDVHFFNVEQGILFFSTTNVFIKNISLVNTSTQAANYTSGMGSDLLNFMYSNDIHIKNIVTNYPVERTLYAINTNNVELDGFIIDNTGLNGQGGGIKFSAGYGGFATNTKIMNGLFTGWGRSDCFDFYNVDGITIDNVDVNATSGMYEMFINAIQQNKNIKVKNCKILNLKSNFIYGAVTATTVLGGNTVNTANVYENISIEDCYILNPVATNDSSGRFLIQFNNVNSNNMSDPNFFLFNHFTFRNNTVIQTLDGSNIDVNYLEDSSKLLAMFDTTTPVQNLLYDNNHIKGAKSDGFLSGLLSTSTGVVRGKLWMIETSKAPVPAGVYLLKCDLEVNVDRVTNGYYKNKFTSRQANKYTCEIELDYSPSASEVKYVYRSSTTYPTYVAFGEIIFDDGTFEKFKVVNNAGTLSLAHVIGDGTLSSGNITFSNGAQVELGSTYKELRVRQGATPHVFYMKVNIKVA